MANRSERQLHESVQKALMKYFPHVKETTAQQLEAIKALLFYRKKDTFASYLLGIGNPLKSFKLATVKLQVIELQKANVKACCLHDLTFLEFVHSFITSLYYVYVPDSKV